MRHIAVVIEVIPGQVGKPGCGDYETVEPTLVETVARGLDRHLLDAPRGKRGEIMMERDRVRCRQGARTSLFRGHQPKRPKARRGKADRRPDLADEVHDRGLAVGARNGDDGTRLPTIKACRQKRQSAMWVWVDQDRDALATLRRELRASASSVRIATAPRDTASAAKTRPSSRVPGRAAKRKPGRTVRELALSPAISGSARGKATAARPLSSVSLNPLTL